MKFSPVIVLTAVGGLVAASPALGLLAPPATGIGQVQMSVEKQDVVRVIVPVSEPGAVAAVAEYTTVEGETTSIGHYEITYPSVQPGQTIRIALTPGHRAQRILKRRGHLTVFVSVALHDSSGGLSETRPKKLVLHLEHSHHAPTAGA
jgi:hypothetical protein